jgi:ribosomal protein L37AE/L43A
MGEDYSKTLMAMEERFSSEIACRDYLAALRWADGFVCPACGGTNAGRMQRGLWHCRSCERQTSVLAGTVFQDTHLALTVWFRAMWHMTSQKNGISALGLQRVLGLGSYRTAWTMLHKLRRAMVRPGRGSTAGTGRS